MAKNRKANIGRLLLVVLIGTTIVVGTFFGIKALIKHFSNNNQNDEVIDEPVNEEDVFDITLNSYFVYTDTNKDLGFNFVVADLKFSDDENINYSLNNLITDEGFKLDDIYTFFKKMANASYNYELLDTDISLPTNDKTINIKVFIPYTTTNNAVTLTDIISGKKINIDLNVNKMDINDIKIVTKENEIISKSYDIKISDSYISTMMLWDGENYSNSNTNVYTFKLKVSSIADGIKITNAFFKQNSTDEVWEALDEEYSSMKIDNIINKTLKTNDEYALFFEVYSNVDETPTYEGTITLNFSDGSDAVIDTTLR